MIQFYDNTFHNAVRKRKQYQYKSVLQMAGASYETPATEMQCLGMGSNTKNGLTGAWACEWNILFGTTLTMPAQRFSEAKQAI